MDSTLKGIREELEAEIRNLEQMLGKLTACPESATSGKLEVAVQLCWSYRQLVGLDACAENVEAYERFKASLPSREEVTRTITEVGEALEGGFNAMGALLGKVSGAFKAAMNSSILPTTPEEETAKEIVNLIKAGSSKEAFARLIEMVPGQDLPVQTVDMIRNVTNAAAGHIVAGQETVAVEKVAELLRKIQR